MAARNDRTLSHACAPKCVQSRLSATRPPTTISSSIVAAAIATLVESVVGRGSPSPGLSSQSSVSKYQNCGMGSAPAFGVIMAREHKTMFFSMLSHDLGRTGKSGQSLLCGMMQIEQTTLDHLLIQYTLCLEHPKHYDKSSVYSRLSQTPHG